MLTKQKVRNAFQNPRRAIKVISNSVFSLNGHRDFKPFIILSRSRSGSNLLVSFLNSHPNVFSEAEIFGGLSKKSYQQILARTFKPQPYYCKAKGFKIFYYHPRDKLAEDVWDALEEMDNLHVIHLKRKNILHTLLSRRIAGIRDNWVSKSNSAVKKLSKDKVDVDFDHDLLKAGFEKTRKWEKDAEHRFRNHPMISIDYEDLTGDPENTFRQITDFLGVKSTKPNTITKKQSNRKIRDTIPNYDELKESFKDTEWASFFDE